MYVCTNWVLSHVKGQGYHPAENERSIGTTGQKPIGTTNENNWYQAKRYQPSNRWLRYVGVTKRSNNLLPGNVMF
jgi:hypothetical protein